VLNASVVALNIFLGVFQGPLEKRSTKEERRRSQLISMHRVKVHVDDRLGSLGFGLQPSHRRNQTQNETISSFHREQVYCFQILRTQKTIPLGWSASWNLLLS